MVTFLKKIAKLQHAAIFLTIIFIVLTAYQLGMPFLELIELKTIDLRFKSREKINPGRDVVLAVVDDKSLAREGNWAWPRIKIADLVTRLSNAGAKVIAFDIGFFEPDNKRIIKAIENIQREMQDLNVKNRKVNRYLEKLKHATDNDQRLADAITKSSAKIVLGYFFETEPQKVKYLNEKEIELHKRNISTSKYHFEYYSSEEARNIDMDEPIYPQSNIDRISKSTKYSGYFNMYPDQDGVVRWMPGVLKFGDIMYAPLSMSALAAFLDSPLSIEIEDYGVREIKIGRFEIPTDEDGRVLINYRGEEKLFDHISVTDILNNRISDSVFKNKIVMVGVTAVAVYDLRVTPFGTVFPGLEIHASVVDSVLAEDYLYRPNWAGIFDILAIILTGLVVGIILPRVSVVPGILIAFGVFFSYILFCQYLFAKLGLVLNMVYPLTIILSVYVCITAYRYFVETKQKRFIKDAFSTYLAPSVVKQLTDSPESLKLGGEEREITAFFSDVQGFTGISEALPPGKLVELLNEFLTEMADIILKHEGTVDKFEGDAIIAFFGAPILFKNHAERTCRACIEMQKRLGELRRQWRSENRPELKMRIGLCTGPAVIGNMGTKTRMDYTMMGDTVNTAARLEGVNKIYGIYTLINETTYHAAGNGFMYREIDSILVVGKKEPVSIYQLFGYPDEIDSTTKKMIEHYKLGLEKYRLTEWAKAMEHFKAALEIIPSDGPSRTMLARCAEYAINPPGKEWNGSFDIMTK